MPDISTLGFVGIAIRQVALFEDNPLPYIEVLKTCQIPRKILCETYWVLTYRGIAPPIESLLLEEKETLWASAKDFGAGFLGGEKCIEFIKALYTLNFLIHEKDLHYM